MQDIIKGKVWTFGDNIDTDLIIPARYLNTFDPKELAAHCMEDADPDFVNKISAGDIILAGENFGCGSSREHAPISIKAAGISCVVASSFARIFFRNAINIGLPVLEVQGLYGDSETGDIIELAPDTGEVKNLTKGRTYNAAAFPPFIKEIINAGGLIPWIAKNKTA